MHATIDREKVNADMEGPMVRHTRRLGKIGFALVILGALGFGTVQALSLRPKGEDCQPCATTTECAKCCFEELGWPNGTCFPPNCICW